jgi:alkanesulfonate monooxygenase SsuD/methylene tetrahydromethanopterin reductase-like flavin-dependent oxidoreductase (luciferase family)
MENMMKHGFGVSAMIEHDLIAPLAQRAEAAGYQTFWVNDVPGASGLEQLKRAQGVTSEIRLGIGVLAVDRWGGAEIIREVIRLGLDQTRLVLGIGAGALHKGSLTAVSTVAQALKSLEATVMIGALGPRMVDLAGSSTDGVILNWLTPEAADSLSAVARNNKSTEVVAYVRTAADEAARDRLEKESLAYEGYPSYKRHFDRMGVRAIDTTVLGSRAEIQDEYGRYAQFVDELVCRAITSSEQLEEYLAVLYAAAPDVTT